MENRGTILVADGNPKTIPNLNKALGELRYEVIASGDALFVLTLALRHKPSAVILGARLPAGGALTALRRLRSSVHTAAIPAVAIAAPGAEKQALLSAGIDHCLEPPVAAEDILGAVVRAIGMSTALAFEGEGRRVVKEAPAEILADPERLSALGETGLLDSEPDEAVDTVTRLAAHILRVPVALVSLVDDRRQFFKSQVGLPSPWDQQRQTPLSHSFCQWVVSSQEELAIADARTHPVLRTNRAVEELGVIAYAGVPLSAPAGQPIGSFCAIDGKPHSWTDDELATLRDLAQVVDAYTALHAPSVVDRTPAARERGIRAAVRAAGRGFLGVARLLRRDRPPFGVEERRQLISIVERHSNRLIDLAADVDLTVDRTDPST